MSDPPACPLCEDSLGSVPTGTFSRDLTTNEYVFTQDGRKTCPGCDGTGVPVRLHKELNIKPGCLLQFC
jgi:hypothetical protein